MPPTGSVTNWIGGARAGDAAAIQKLWETYYQRLVRLARRKLGGAPRRAADEEDVALSAFDSFFRGAQEGRFPQLLDRYDLWQILMVLAHRKAVNLLKHERRQKRGGGRPQQPLTSSLPELISREPDPEFVIEIMQERLRLLDKLGETELQTIAVLKMEGFTNEEIGLKLGRSRATVERKLRLIRSIWQDDLSL